MKRTPKAEQFEPLTAAPHCAGGLAHHPCAARACHRQGENAAAAFSKDATRSQTVATFLAVLELVRAGRVNIDAHENLSVKQRRKGA